MKTSKLAKTIIIVLLFLILSIKPAYAYLDPGTGSYLLQILAAGLLGGIFAVKTFWSNIKGFFAGLFSKEKENAPPKKKNGKK